MYLELLDFIIWFYFYLDKWKSSLRILSIEMYQFTRFILEYIYRNM